MRRPAAARRSAGRRRVRVGRGNTVCGPSLNDTMAAEGPQGCKSWTRRSRVKAGSRMDNRGGDVVVIGAGLIGLAIAFALAERGATVRLYDRGEPGRAASWAGAGMLAPYTERVANEALLEFCASSLR